MPTQEPFSFGTDQFVENPEPRCACVLVLDTSGSMAGEPIHRLNEGLRAYRDDLISDPLATKRVEVAIVTFGPVTVAQDFIGAAQFVPPILEASGLTPLSGALGKAIDIVNARKAVYRNNGIHYYRPWIFLVTDGAPDSGDPWRDAARQIQQGESNGSFLFWSVGVEGADFGVLRELSNRVEPLKLRGLQFREMFMWLSKSQKSVSQAAPNAAIPVASEDPTGPRGWGSIPT